VKGYRGCVGSAYNNNSSILENTMREAINYVRRACFCLAKQDQLQRGAGDRRV
jgi:hypothetical protein